MMDMGKGMMVSDRQYAWEEETMGDKERVGKNGMKELKEEREREFEEVLDDYMLAQATGTVEQEDWENLLVACERFQSVEDDADFSSDARRKRAKRFARRFIHLRQESEIAERRKKERIQEQADRAQEQVEEMERQLEMQETLAKMDMVRNMFNRW